MTIGKYHASKRELLIFILFFFFSAGLMFKTFNVSPEGNLLIATKAWSDFAATIPLIRSFSFGDNIPPEYPIFAGPNIRYHFGFFLIVGTLEKLGLPLSLALNIPSIIGFTLLLVTIYAVSRHVFKSRAVGFLSALFFLFNGSFSFIEYFRQHPVSYESLLGIFSNTSFPSFGPYDGKIVSAFWNLNIYTNQRHLASAYAVFLIVLFIYHRSSLRGLNIKSALLIGTLIGLFPFMHYAVFGMLGIATVIAFFIYPKIRFPIFVIGILAILLALPQVLYMGASSLSIEPVKIGYLITDLTATNFLKYWFMNIGFILPLSIVGFLISDKSQKKVFIPFLALFVFGNIFQVSPEIAANHKFFNLFIIGANMFAAFFLIKIFRKNLFGKLLVMIVSPLLIMSGIIDFFPIVNDHAITITDMPNNKVALFIKNNTSTDSVILNGSYLYDSASLAGRKIYLGWPYFSWSAGYNTDSRFQTLKSILEEDNKDEACKTLNKEGINYIETENPSPFEDINTNHQFFEDEFTKVFENAAPNINIYDVKRSCNAI